MTNLRDFFKTKKLFPRYLNLNNELFRLYLRGLRRIYEQDKTPKPYNYYPKILSLGLSFYFFNYLYH